MNLDNGKLPSKKVKFLERDFVIGKIPVGIAVPLNVEMTKVRVMTFKAAEKEAMKSDTIDNLTQRVEEHFYKYPEEAQEINMQIVKSISIFTEYVTNGEIDEEYIQRNASVEEMANFFAELEEVMYDKQKKAMANLEKEVEKLKITI